MTRRQFVLIGGHLSTSRRDQNQSRPVFCACSKDSSRLIRVGDTRPLVSDQSPTSAKPFCDLCNVSAILTFLSREAVAERLQRQCEQGFTYSVVSYRFNGEEE